MVDMLFSRVLVKKTHFWMETKRRKIYFNKNKDNNKSKLPADYITMLIIRL